MPGSFCSAAASSPGQPGAPIRCWQGAKYSSSARRTISWLVPGAAVSRPVRLKGTYWAAMVLACTQMERQRSSWRSTASRNRRSAWGRLPSPAGSTTTLT